MIIAATFIYFLSTPPSKLSISCPILAGVRGLHCFGCRHLPVGAWIHRDVCAIGGPVLHAACLVSFHSSKLWPCRLVGSPVGLDCGLAQQAHTPQPGVWPGPCAVLNREKATGCILDHNDGMGPAHSNEHHGVFTPSICLRGVQRAKAATSYPDIVQILRCAAVAYVPPSRLERVGPLGRFFLLRPSALPTAQRGDY
eukprot:SAG25_NODE_352_length_9272_cov_9.627385_1_plen_197_part_00